MNLDKENLVVDYVDKWAMVFLTLKKNFRRKFFYFFGVYL